MRRTIARWNGLVIALLLISASAGCMDEIVLRTHEPPRPEAHPMVATNTAGAESHGEGAEIVLPPLTEPLSSDAARVQVFTNSHISQMNEVVGVLDMHTSADSEDKGFDLLRWRAAQLGADAVIGAEFEHGHDGEPSHLSGMAVRFVR